MPNLAVSCSRVRSLLFVPLKSWGKRSRSHIVSERFSEGTSKREVLSISDKWTESCLDGVTEGVETYAKEAALLGVVVGELPTRPKRVRMPILVRGLVGPENIILAQWGGILVPRPRTLPPQDGATLDGVPMFDA